VDLRFSIQEKSQRISNHFDDADSQHTVYPNIEKLIYYKYFFTNLKKKLIFYQFLFLKIIDYDV